VYRAVERPAPSPELHGRRADPALLEFDAHHLPAEIGAPPIAFRPREHRRLINTGVALTGSALLGGAGVGILGLILWLVGHPSLGVPLAVVGAVLVATHWGWIHVAQLAADRRDEGASAAVEAERQAWLARIPAHAHWDIQSRVRESDASILLERVRFSPVPTGDDTFTFTRTVEHVEAFADAPTAEVVERAEELRQAAHADTARARAAWTATVQGVESERALALDSAEELATSAALAEAISEQINANRDLPEA
jgi:hypothetical protein